MTKTAQYKTEEQRRKEAIAKVIDNVQALSKAISIFSYYEAGGAHPELFQKFKELNDIVLKLR